MSDYRITVPAAIFVETIRAVLPQYASESDERVIAIFASENPQCRLIREGDNVSVENLFSVLPMESEHQAEEATPPSEPTHSDPTAGTTFRPVMTDKETSASKVVRTVGEFFRRIPRWCWVPPVVLLVLAIITACLAVGLPEPTIDNQVYELHKTGHPTLSNAVLHLSCMGSSDETCILRGENSLYTKACDDSDAHSCSSLADLASMYLFGQGAAQDYSRAFTLFTEACNGGNADACERLGEMFRDSKGVRWDWNRALANFRKACDLGECTRLHEAEYEARRNTTLASIHFWSDPQNNLPVIRIEDLFERLYARRNSLDIEQGQKVRVIATLTDENLNNASLYWTRNPKPFLFQNIEFEFPSSFLQALQPGDEVEFIAKFDSLRTDPSDRYASETMRFRGWEIQKVTGVSSEEYKQASEEMPRSVASQSLTWTDPATGLMWTRKDNGRDVTLQEATSYCLNLRLAGHSDWRLVTSDELHSIYDTSISFPGKLSDGTPVDWNVKGHLQLSGLNWGSNGRVSILFSLPGSSDLSHYPLGNGNERALCVRRSGD